MGVHNGILARFISPNVRAKPVEARTGNPQRIPPLTPLAVSASKPVLRLVEGGERRVCRHLGLSCQEIAMSSHPLGRLPFLYKYGI